MHDITKPVAQTDKIMADSHLQRRRDLTQQLGS